MEQQIAVEKSLQIAGPRQFAHDIHRCLQQAEALPGLSSEASRQTLNRAAQLVYLGNVAFAEMDHTRAPARRFDRESLVREDMDGFADRCLRHSKFRGPLCLHNALSGFQ